MGTITIISFGIFVLIAFCFLAHLTFKMLQWKTQQCVKEMREFKESILNAIETKMGDTFNFDDDDDDDDDEEDGGGSTFREKNRVKRYMN